MTSWEIMENSPLLDFLTKNTTTDNNQITHQLLPKVIKNYSNYKFSIQSNQYEEFIKLYYNHVYLEKLPMSLMEKIGDVSAFYCDIDLKYLNKKNDINCKQYTSETLELISKLLLTGISKFIPIDCDDREKCRCFIMEKETVTLVKDNKYGNIAKDGIHIIFPKIIIDRKLSEYIINEICKDKYATLGEIIIQTLKTPLIDINHKSTNKLSNILDDSIYKSGKMIMLGSTKTDGKPYKATQVYILENNNNYNIDNFTSIGLTKLNINMYDTRDLLSQNSLYNKDESLKCEYFEDTDELLCKKTSNVSKLDSIKKTKTKTKPKTSFNIIDTHYLNNIKKYNPLIEQEISIIKKLIDILSIERADEYLSWIKVGICLKNIDDDLLDTWIHFSKKSKKYTSGECEKHWFNNFKSEVYCGTNLKEGSLYYWAKCDNHVAYDNIIKKQLETYVKKAAKTRGHSDIARVVYESAKYDFVCVGIDKKEWFTFNKKTTRWETMDGAINLRRYINNEITDLFGWYQQEYNDGKNKLNSDDDLYDTLDKRSNGCAKIFIDLKTTNFKDNVVKECRDLYYDKEFLDKLDNNTYLFGLENCLFDLDKGEFRLGEPSDFVSLSCGVSLPLSYNINLPIGINQYSNKLKTALDYEELNNGLNDFIDKILPISAVKEYTIRKLSSCILGEIREEKFHIWTGSGGNGKSKLIDLVEHCFGEYACKLPVSLLTQKRGQSSSANPELARTRGIRFISLQEPNANEKVNLGLMKELTGGDKITTRALFKNPIDFKPQFTLFLMCNQLPQVPGDDDGTWRRMEVVEFISRFKCVSNDNKKENIYKMDTQLSEKLDKWKLPFLIKLFSKFYNEYNRPKSEGGGMIIPAEVVKQTTKYRQENDIITHIMDNYFVLSDKKLKFIEIWTNFKQFASDEDTSHTLPTRPEFEKKLRAMQDDSPYGHVSDKKGTNSNNTLFNYTLLVTEDIDT